MHKNTDELLSTLTALDINYENHEHPPVFTVEQARTHCAHIPGGHCKNLFLRTKKKAMWLVVLHEDTHASLKTLATLAGAGGWGFASEERLLQHLGVAPGSVTPLALINDVDHSVSLVIERRLMDYALLNFHPLVNSATLSLTPADLLKFARSIGHEPMFIDVDEQ